MNKIKIFGVINLILGLLGLRFFYLNIWVFFEAIKIFSRNYEEPISINLLAILAIFIVAFFLPFGGFGIYKGIKYLGSNTKINVKKEIITLVISLLIGITLTLVIFFIRIYNPAPGLRIPEDVQFYPPHP